MARQVGREVSVLMESERMGRTEQFAEVALSSDRTVGEIFPVKISGIADGRLQAA